MCMFNCSWRAETRDTMIWHNIQLLMCEQKLQIVDTQGKCDYKCWKREKFRWKRTKANILQTKYNAIKYWTLGKKPWNVVHTWKVYVSVQYIFCNTSMHHESVEKKVSETTACELNSLPHGTRQSFLLLLNIWTQTMSKNRKIS